MTSKRRRNWLVWPGLLWLLICSSVIVHVVMVVIAIRTGGEP